MQENQSYGVAAQGVPALGISSESKQNPKRAKMWIFTLGLPLEFGPQGNWLMQFGRWCCRTHPPPACQGGGRCLGLNFAPPLSSHKTNVWRESHLRGEFHQGGGRVQKHRAPHFCRGRPMPGGGWVLLREETTGPDCGSAPALKLPMQFVPADLTSATRLRCHVCCGALRGPVQALNALRPVSISIIVWMARFVARARRWKIASVNLMCYWSRNAFINYCCLVEKIDFVACLDIKKSSAIKSSPDIPMVNPGDISRRTPIENSQCLTLWNRNPCKWQDSLFFVLVLCLSCGHKVWIRCPRLSTEVLPLQKTSSAWCFSETEAKKRRHGTKSDPISFLDK